MGELRLVGCRAEPLGSYLKALGVFRLVGEQLDPSATACWEGDEILLSTDHSLEDVLELLVHDYRPTPIVSPWNGGSGFHPKDNLDGISAIEGSTGARLAGFRRTIEAARNLVANPRWSELPKEQQVQWCRNVLPDGAVRWLDAAVVLSAGGPAFPPLLGTGGNVGRLDFSNNFMQRLSDILLLKWGRGAPTSDTVSRWLLAALTGTEPGDLMKKAVGQFDPGAAGGTNAPEGGPEVSVVNPWDYVLTFEGALLFASSAARRMSMDVRGKAAMPFTFDETPAGFSSAVADETSKGELWTPLWSRPTGLAEVTRLLAEGRAEWGGSHARRGVDAARAATSLGVDRGIDGFVRHVIVERMGQAMLAVPVGRISTETQKQVPVLAELDRWVERVRRAKNVPAAPATALRRLDSAMIRLTTRGGPRLLQDVLIAGAELELTVARSGALREQVPEPLGNAVAPRFGGGSHPSLEAHRWVPLLDDGSPEFRLAIALASCRNRWSPVSPPSESGERRGTPALLLRGIQRASNGRWEWRPDGRPVVPGLDTSGLDTVLAAFVRRRAIEASVRGRAPFDVTDSSATSSPVGIDLGATAGAPARLEDVLSFVDGAIDERRLSQLLAASLLLRFDSRTPRFRPVPARPPRLRDAAAPLVLPFFHDRAIELRGRTQARVRLQPAHDWPRLLSARRVDEVVADACHRLRVARLVPLVADARSIARNTDGERLLAATCFPLTSRSASVLLSKVTVPSEQLEAKASTP